MARDEGKSPADALDDSGLDAVMGGTSLYDGATGVDRESWFVNLMTRLMSIPGGEAAKQAQRARAGTFFNGNNRQQH